MPRWMVLCTSALCFLFPPSAIAQIDLPTTGSGTTAAVMVQAPAVQKAHAKHLTGLVISTDGKLLVSASEDDTVKVWAAPERRLLATLRVPDKHLRDFQLLPDGRGLVTTHHDGKTRLWSLPEGQLLTTVEGELIDVSPDGKVLVTRKDGLTLRSLPDGELLKAIKEETGICCGAHFSHFAISPDSKTLVLVDERPRGVWVKAWSLPGGEYRKSVV